MKKLVLAVAVAASFVSTAAFACDGDHSNQASWEPRAASVGEVAKWTKSHSATAIDANGPQTREKEGVIPGAVLLTSSSQYDVKELPADKAGQLVFYCANDKCGASHQAAKRAYEAGYTNVAVLPVGIKGWKAAGQPTAKPNS